ncbi:MAG TPA: ABC transporter ATP-binding protein [Tepidisphaeraceae bacterium]|jgi:ATP-binding cassette subfamily B protein|nr:ABC transporter ATP-binding protein [Tepidisphaeraceae bacterium]
MEDGTHIFLGKVRRAAAQIRDVPGAIGLAWQAARGLTVAWSTLLLVQGLLPIATVFLTRAIVDALVAARASGGAWHSARRILPLIAFIGLVLLLSELLRALAAWVSAAQAERVKDHISGLIHRKSVAVDLAFYDLSDYYDHLHRARGDASYHPAVLLESTGGLLQNGITLIAMIGVLIPFGVWLPLALGVSAVPALLVVLRCTMLQHAWRVKSTPVERRAWYYDWALTSADTAAELRLFGLGKYFQSHFEALRRRLRGDRVRMAAHEGLAELLAGFFALLVSGLVMGWMIWRALGGIISLGQLALFYQAFNQGLGLVRSSLGNIGRIYSTSLFLGNLFEFLRLEPKVTNPPRAANAPHTLARQIRFEHVTFRYPGSERIALRDFNLVVPAGQVVALVGPNGAGKSTLIKLLCRMYDPDGGRIELDGIDLRDFDLASLRRVFTVLFQQPVRYNATVAENIAMGDVEATPSAEDIRAAAAAAGADEIIARLPGGYEMLLAKGFTDGTDLSVGEWQRLALARAFLRQAPVILLDEPTSAMDSWAEADWMDRFRALAAGRTAIIITHRFTTAMHADTIHVMSEGRIVESGSHAQLLAQEGLYGESWRAQTQAVS